MQYVITDLPHGLKPSQYRKPHAVNKVLYLNRTNIEINCVMILMSIL